MPEGSQLQDAASKPITIAVCRPNGRDVMPIFHTESYNREVLSSRTFDSHPLAIYPFGILGDEYARARNGIVDMVLQFERDRSLRFDYLLWLDDDIVLPENFLSTLLSRNLPIVSGLYVMRRPPYLPVAYYSATEGSLEGKFWNLDAYPPDSLVEVDAVGHGCTLIRREVYDNIPLPYYAWRPLNWQPGDTERADQNTLGEDMYFFSKCRQAGYRVTLDTSVKCGHVGSFVYTENLFLGNQGIYRRTPTPGKLSILFLAAPAPKPWDYNTMSLEGLGGSESAVAYVADQLANRHGHTVYVVGGSAPNHIHGVNYRPYTMAATLMAQSWDVVVVSRWYDVLPQVSANTGIKLVVFWGHDVMDYAQVRWAYTYSNVFVTVSQWHAGATYGPFPENTPDLTEIVIPNGVDMALFSGEEERISHRLIWTSNPNRGLPTALRVFKELRKKHSDMELHIYGRAAVYGWGGDAEAPWIPRPDQVGEKEGVYLHEPLPKPELARELMRSFAWFYPHHYLETSSIAALEAQAAGTPVIAPPLAALRDTVDGGILEWDIMGSMEALEDEASWELLSLRGREWARKHDWAVVGDKWEKMIQEELKKGG